MRNRHERREGASSTDGSEKQKQESSLLSAVTTNDSIEWETAV